MNDIKEKVEEIGVFLEETGLTPMEARVFSLLLLTDPPEMDFFAIQHYLKASKSTISNALKVLIASGRVDYRTKPGDRKRYFKVSPEKWLTQIQDSLAAITPFTKTMQQVIELRKYSDAKAFNQELLKIQRYFLFFGAEVVEMKAKWEELNK